MYSEIEIYALSLFEVNIHKKDFIIKKCLNILKWINKKSTFLNGFMSLKTIIHVFNSKSW